MKQHQIFKKSLKHGREHGLFSGMLLFDHLARDNRDEQSEINRAYLLLLLRDEARELQDWKTLDSRYDLTFVAGPGDEIREMKYEI